MPRTCITEQSARRQRWIEDGLLELMLRRTFDEITVSDLCRHLELPRRSFYRYFRDLPDVLDSLLEHTFQDMAVSDRPLTLEEFAENYRFWRERRELLDALSRSGRIRMLFEYTVRYTNADGIRNYIASDDPDRAREISTFIITGFISLVIGWHADGFRRSPEEMAKLAWSLLFSPILKEP